MAGTINQQYRPISSLEVSADDGYGVRTIIDHSRNVNNGVVYVFNHTILGMPCVPWWYSHDNTIEERVIAILCGTMIAQPYNKLAWSVCHNKTAETGASDAVTWKLYSSKWQYYGDGTMDTTTLSPGYGSASVTSDTLSTDTVPAPSTLNVVRGADAWCWLTLTATNDNVSTRGCLKSISIWPVLV